MDSTEEVLMASKTASKVDTEQNMFPSLKRKHSKVHGWIQWKGTDVCMDVYCKCGHHSHIDSDFTYHIKCSNCGQVYECDGHINLIPLIFEPDGTKETDL
jgi:hypothetical protein